jgi:hypothetical protein
MGPTGSPAVAGLIPVYTASPPPLLYSSLTSLHVYLHHSASICARQRATAASLLPVLRFPLPIIPLAAPHLTAVRAWHMRPSSGRRAKWTVSTRIQPSRKISRAAVWWERTTWCEWGRTHARTQSQAIPCASYNIPYTSATGRGGQ